MRKLGRKIDFTLVIIICSIIICSVFYFKGKLSGEKFNSELWKATIVSDENNSTLR